MSEDFAALVGQLISPSRMALGVVDLGARDGTVLPWNYVSWEGDEVIVQPDGAIRPSGIHSRVSIMLTPQSFVETVVQLVTYCKEQEIPLPPM